MRQLNAPRDRPTKMGGDVDGAQTDGGRDGGAPRRWEGMPRRLAPHCQTGEGSTAAPRRAKDAGLGVGVSQRLLRVMSLLLLLLLLLCFVLKGREKEDI